MNLLLDTHALLWWLDDSPCLSPKARSAISNGKNLVFVSAVVVWEIRIKEALGKLEIPPDFTEILEQLRFDQLPVTVEHAHAVGDLPFHHRDPFDRMLIAQTKIEGFTLVTHDGIFSKYSIPVLKT